MLAWPEFGGIGLHATGNTEGLFRLLHMLGYADLSLGCLLKLTSTRSNLSGSPEHLVRWRGQRWRRKQENCLRWG